MKTWRHPQNRKYKAYDSVVREGSSWPTDKINVLRNGSAVWARVFTARRYTSAVYAVIVCLSVRPSVTSLYRNDWTIRARFGIHVSYNEGIYFPPRLCPKLWTSKISLRQVDHVIVDGRACWSYLRRSTHRGWTRIVYYTSVGHNAVTPLFGFVIQLVHTVVHQLPRFRLTAPRAGPSAVAQLLVSDMRVDRQTDTLIAIHRTLPGVK